MALEAPRILIVEDHPLFLDALRSALDEGLPGGEIVVAETLSEARASVSASRFELVLMDLRLPDASGLDGLRELRALAHGAPVAVISAVNGAEVAATARAGGARGFIHKSQRRGEIVECVRRMLAGEHVFPAITAAEARAAQDTLIERLRQLTPQQLKVLQRVCEAKLNKQIAFELGVTETTIKAHITLIFKKLGVHSRTQAVLQLQRMRSELENSEFAMLLQAAEQGQ